MFTANKKALRCPRTLFEFEIVALVYCVFIRFMLLVMSGHLGGITNNLGLRPVISALLTSMTNPSPAFLRLVVRDQQPLITLFCVPETFALPRTVLVLVVEYVSDPLDVKLLDLFEVDHAAGFLAHFVPSDAHICFLQKLLPLMAEKLRERQPLLVPGGEYATLSAEEEKQCEAAPTTSNSQESDFSITDRKMLSCPSMTVDTVSTHVKLEQNDTFPWLWELPRTDRFRYVMLAKALARVRTKEKKQLRASFVQSRTDKAKADEAAHATRAKTVVKTAMPRRTCG